jgi:DnaK suppressor protein
VDEKMKAPIKKKTSAVKKPIASAKAPAKKVVAKAVVKAMAKKAAPKKAAAKPVPKATAKANVKALAKARAAKPVSKTSQPVAQPKPKAPLKTPVKKPAAKPIAKTVAKPITKPAAKTAVKAPAKPAAKLPVKVVAKAASKPAPKPPVKVAAKAPVKAPAKPVAKPTAKPAVKAAPVKTVPPKAPVVVPAKVALPPAVPMLNKAAIATAPPLPMVKPKSGKAGFMSPSNIAPKPMEVSTAAKTNFTMSSPVFVPPPPIAVKKDAKLANNWKTKTPATLTDAEAIAMPDSEYMKAMQLAFFRLKLMQLKKDILNSAGQTTEHLREDTSVVPDPADRATIEEEHALELRTRDRERKLLKKIEQSIARIDSDDYGYCDETGEAIGVARLIARPTASLSLEAQQRRELKQKMFGD